MKMFCLAMCVIKIFKMCLCVEYPQSVKILTYREPQNPEYKDFVSRLKTDAMDMFNFSVEDSLVRFFSGNCADHATMKEQNKTFLRSGSCY